MGINNIIFPSFTIVELYKHALIEPAFTQSKTEPARQPDDIKWLGNNEKNILICVQYPETAFIPDQQFTFLTTMLTACKLSMQDVAIVNFSNQPYRQIIDLLRPRNVFLFGIEPVTFGMPVNFPMYQVQPLQNSSFLYSPALEDLEKDNVLKSKLWVCLKRIFSI